MGCCRSRNKDVVVQVKPKDAEAKDRPDYGHLHHGKEEPQQGKEQPAAGTAAASTAPASTEVTGTDPNAVEGVPVDVEPPLRKNSNKKTEAREYEESHHSAATRMAAHYRGARDRDHVRDIYRSTSGKESLTCVTDLGLRYVEMWPRGHEISEDLRYGVRDCTARSALFSMGYKDSEMRLGFETCAYNLLWGMRSDRSCLPAAVQKQMALVRHYVDPIPDQKAQSDKYGYSSYQSSYYSYGRSKQEQYIVGQFDCIAVPVRADYDIFFKPIPAGRHPIPLSLPAVNAPGARPELPALTNESNLPPSDHSNHRAANGRDEPVVGITVEAPSDCDGADGFAGWFWVVHAAAPNIGERANADDFNEYSKEEASSKAPSTGYSGYSSYGGYTYGTGTYGTYQYSSGAVNGSLVDSRGLVQPCWKGRYGRRRLDEDHYIKDMHRLWRNSLLAFKRLDVDDAILFPFGMGAFLRHLGQNDDRYNEEKAMRRLRRRIADGLMDAIVEICIGEEPTGGGKADSNKKKPSSGKGKPPGKCGPARVYICLIVGNAESVENHNCFVEAAAERMRTCPKLEDVLKLMLNADCLQLAHNLSCSQWQTKGTPKVGILNGANRKLLGNHWFQNGARSAIDENMHRRSSSMARSSLLLNMNTEPRYRRPGQLMAHVVRWGGQVISASDGKVLHEPSSAEPAKVDRGNAHHHGYGQAEQRHYGGGYNSDYDRARYGRYVDDDDCCCDCCGCCSSRRPPRHKTTSSDKKTASSDTGSGTTVTPSQPPAVASKGKKPAAKSGWS
mmetsp:Transcript_18026/g.32716  ORF Transcript_18026/g.32716 Transcript_18026/m.32716 type:complete len:785 (-) Transcript_18026:44-2398(-)